MLCKCDLDFGWIDSSVIFRFQCVAESLPALLPEVAALSAGQRVVVGVSGDEVSQQTVLPSAETLSSVSACEAAVNQSAPSPLQSVSHPISSSPTQPVNHPISSSPTQPVNHPISSSPTQPAPSPHQPANTSTNQSTSGPESSPAQPLSQSSSVFSGTDVISLVESSREARLERIQSEIAVMKSTMDQFALSSSLSLLSVILENIVAMITHSSSRSKTRRRCRSVPSTTTARPSKTGSVRSPLASRFSCSWDSR